MLCRDGAGVHVHIGPQNGILIYRNWAHHITAKAFRFDRVNSAGATWGTNGTAVQNVAWRCGAACFKGDKHTIANNTVFDSSDEQSTAALFVMMYDPTKAWSIKGENAHTLVSHNAADSIFNVSGQLPGVHTGNVAGIPIRPMLQDPDNADFRPVPRHLPVSRCDSCTPRTVVLCTLLVIHTVLAWGSPSAGHYLARRLRVLLLAPFEVPRAPTGPLECAVRRLRLRARCTRDRTWCAQARGAASGKSSGNRCMMRVCRADMCYPSRSACEVLLAATANKQGTTAVHLCTLYSFELFEQLAYGFWFLLKLKFTGSCDCGYYSGRGCIRFTVSFYSGPFSCTSWLRSRA